MSQATIVNPGIERQEQYVAQQSATGDDSLIVGGAFVRGIRDLGYQNTPKAIDELIDNAIQARASNIHIWFSTSGKPASVTSYAVIDDGLGMIPSMLPFAAKWGGTEREGDRKGLGRYGFGLPSSCVSQGERFRIFSRTSGGPLMSVTVDLQDLQIGDGGKITAPKPVEVELPSDLASYLKKQFGNFEHGTIVLVDKLDHLTWTSPAALQKHLLEHVGLVYRNYVNDRTFVVDGRIVTAVDPLFLTPGARHYDLPDDSDRAAPYEPIKVPMKTSSGQEVVINVRASYLPPRFGYVEKDNAKNGGKNSRMSVMSDHEGLIVLRMGRQMDVIMRNPWGKDEEDEEAVGTARMASWRAGDRYWQIEIDFPAELDEKFSVTTSKQSVRLDPSVWDALDAAGVRNIIKDARKRLKTDTARIKVDANHDQTQKRPSEQAMEEAAEFKGSKASEEQSAAAERNEARAASEARDRAEQTGLPLEAVQAALNTEIERRKFVISQESMVGAPFYRPEGIGAQLKVWLNTAHPFFTELYGAESTSPETQAALEVLLFVLASEEVNATSKREEFYIRERLAWSNEMRTALKALTRILPSAA